MSVDVLNCFILVPFNKEVKWNWEVFHFNNRSKRPTLLVFAYMFTFTYIYWRLLFKFSKLNKIMPTYLLNIASIYICSYVVAIDFFSIKYFLVGSAWGILQVAYSNHYPRIGDNCIAVNNSRYKLYKCYFFHMTNLCFLSDNRRVQKGG